MWAKRDCTNYYILFQPSTLTVSMKCEPSHEVVKFALFTICKEVYN